MGVQPSAQSPLDKYTPWLWRKNSRALWPCPTLLKSWLFSKYFAQNSSPIATLHSLLQYLNIQRYFATSTFEFQYFLLRLRKEPNNLWHAASLKSSLAGDIWQVIMLNRYKCLTWLTETGEVKAGEKFVYQRVSKVCLVLGHYKIL